MTPPREERSSLGHAPLLSPRGMGYASIFYITKSQCCEVALLALGSTLLPSLPSGASSLWRRAIPGSPVDKGSVRAGIFGLFSDRVYRLSCPNRRG
jgi:hypothetical protein